MGNVHHLRGLLVRVRGGEATALDQLLRILRPYLHLLVRRQLEAAHVHAFVDSDVVQETLMRVHGALDPHTRGSALQFQGDATPMFLGWVSQIARNVIVDLERRGLAKKRDRRREVPGAQIFATIAQGATPQQVAQRAEAAVALAAALDRLPPHQRQLVEWRFFAQRSYADISAETGKSEGALRVVVKRALETLRGDRALKQLMGHGE